MESFESLLNQIDSADVRELDRVVAKIWQAHLAASSLCAASWKARTRATAAEQRRDRPRYLSLRCLLVAHGDLGRDVLVDLLLDPADRAVAKSSNGGAVMLSP